jgi:hypothetical protein
MDQSCHDPERISAQEALPLIYCHVTSTENKLLSAKLSPLLLIATSSGCREFYLGLQGRLRPLCNLITQL